MTSKAAIMDNFGRKIEYLRISVTDRCNLRCMYCMPEEGVHLKRHSDMLSFESIALIAGEAGRVGFRKIRLTGGEPLVRREIEVLVGMLAACRLFEEITMTTNGTLLTREKARMLKDAGLTRVNISLDTLDPVRYSKITRGGSLAEALSGIKAAKGAGLDPVKINMVVLADTTHGEIDRMRSFCAGEGLSIQTIRHFTLIDRTHKGEPPLPECDRPLPCGVCNRIRLTADGFLKPCLFSDLEIPVNLADAERSIREAIDCKPVQGTSCRGRPMNQIGG